MPTPTSPSPGFVRPGATTASKSSTGPHGRKSGRQRVPSGAPFFRSTTPFASSNRRESSGPALEINSKPRQNGQSRAQKGGENAESVPLILLIEEGEVHYIISFSDAF